MWYGDAPCRIDFLWGTGGTGDVLKVAPVAGRARAAQVGDRFDALVLDAGTRQSLATTRSLGRAGLRVAAAECFAECDPSVPVLSFRSRYCAAELVLPSFTTCPGGFADGVVEFVRQYPTRVVVPASDGAVAALLPRRADLERLGSRLTLPATEALVVANDKDSTLAAAQRLGIAGPATVRVDTVEDLPRLFELMPFPFVLKPTTSWAAPSCLRLQAVDVVDRDEAQRVATDFFAHGVGALGQVWVGGRREGVTLFLDGGELKAAFAHLEVRTTPQLGGASVVRESIPLPDDLLESSVLLARDLGLDGLCHVEYRRDAVGRPMLMEINARMAGTIGIAVACGVDLPLMLFAWGVGATVDAVTSYVVGRRMRWLRGDMRWLRDNHRRVGRPDSVSRLRGIATFFGEFFRGSRLDCFDARDLRPMLAELRAIVASVRQGLGRSHGPRQLQEARDAK